MAIKILVILFFLITGTTILAQDYTFDTVAQQKQFETLTEELRCLVCQNENLMDSRAPLAKDLRAEIYLKIKRGENNDTIKAYLVDRYGQFILFKPALNGATYLLWIAPFVLLILAFSIVAIVIRGRRSKF